MTDTKNITAGARRAAKLLIDACIARGATAFVVKSEIDGDTTYPVTDGAVNRLRLLRDVFDYEEATIDVMDEGRICSRVLFLPGNGIEAITDYTWTGWAQEAIDPIFDKLES